MRHPVFLILAITTNLCSGMHTCRLQDAYLATVVKVMKPVNDHSLKKVFSMDSH